jgi:hypothetical protein
MATPQLVSVRDFTTSRYAQIAENTEGQLTDILARAEEHIQGRLGRRLLTNTWIEFFRAKSQILFVRNRPITSVTSIRRRSSPFYSWVTVPIDLIHVEAEAGYVECVEPVAGYYVEVTYTAGYPSEAIPEDIKEAILMQAVLFSFQDLEVYGSGDAKAPGIQYFHSDIDRILRFHRSGSTVYH